MNWKYSNNQDPVVFFGRKKQYIVTNPSFTHHIIAEDPYEAVHKAKRLDQHIYSNDQYQVYEKLNVYTAHNKK